LATRPLGGGRRVRGKIEFDEGIGMRWIERRRVEQVFHERQFALADAFHNALGQFVAAEGRLLDVHVHACDNASMRTTIEMKPEHRARILELAANRGEKGFSTVVAEALELYLEAESGRTNAIQSALALKGSMRAAEAASLLTCTRKIRADWR